MPARFFRSLYGDRRFAEAPSDDQAHSRSDTGLNHSASAYSTKFRRPFRCPKLRSFGLSAPRHVGTREVLLSNDAPCSYVMG